MGKSYADNPLFRRDATLRDGANKIDYKIKSP